MAELPADFEESEFRGPLFNQLLRGNNLLWEPGQVFEEHIGIDYAALVEHELFWRYRNGRYRDGLPLAGVGLGYIWKKKKKGKALPPFALNLFIQAKRSNQRSPVPKKARDKGLATPCWFFNIDQQQQAALHRLSSALKGKGLVCYAAPAFLSQSDLYHHTEKRSIVQNSTFPSAGKLQGHSRWYYDRHGTFGIANPQFERVEVGQIDAQIEALSNRRDGVYESIGENLSFLAEAVNSTTDDPSNISSRDTWFSHLAQLLNDEAEAVLGDMPSEMMSYLRIRAYCHAYNLEWLSLQ
ncbi:hypothetical protein [Xanthomonas arboricola]|uniref:hypothetical protein n=1 Tax=Xanthomonas arboricola TaxID=56448 RepID=UPI001431D9AA|nr:hypothetical protein [Xanthomonas arboricola]NJB78852.1 hypothetical protein [Xanthomonas arboricola]